ncbi:hypothetical protein [Kitasatospora sp. CB02891]|uniref:hypothetical protein n=1 Tax=Kitasatospora sp. CB02891 TaxID=2020329 RepID=UPI000C272E7E|nr:hypothetical protein [Kitasatospora sp. CB02891]PJN25104.1 hypothetical protein CG736_16670 [Kitasatospora sp. CB02891]
MAFVQPLQSNPRPGGRGLPAIGFLLLVQVAIELAVLGYDLSRSGLHYLPIALGVPVDAQYWVPAPAAFTGYDTALVITALVLAFGAVNGRRWARPGAVAVLAVNGYGSATALITTVVNGGADGILHQDATFLLLTATLVLDVVIALVVVLIAAAGREQSAPAPSPYPAPYPPAAPAPGAWGTPSRPAGPAGYWPPQPPSAAPSADAGPGFGAGFGAPPPPPVPPAPPVPPSV